MVIDTAPSVLAVLKQARALIDAPEKWTKGAFGRDADGKARSLRLEQDIIVCRCSVGAITTAARANWSHERRAVEFAVKAKRLDAMQGIFKAVTWFNDDPKTTHADVLAMFDRAIELASREGAVNHE